MRLERLEIAGFGRLRNRHVQFGSQVTVILGRNESGKSTIHRAVRAALYGIDPGGQGRPVERSDWARWQPWSPGAYGIALTYRLATGSRLRVAHRLDHREARSQVQELGGGDVTDRLRAGRLVSPAQFHLGIDEAVFCTAAWLGDEGLRLGAADSPGQRAPALQEAIERLADSGSEGVTAAEAVSRLRAALARIGSERRPTSPLGVAVTRLRTLDLEIDEARHRLSAFVEEEGRRQRLEAAAAVAAAEALGAERAWLLGRLAGLDSQERDMEESSRELSELAATIEGHAAWAAFPVTEEERVIALGGELRQADRAAAESEARARAGEPALSQVRRRRAEIQTGLNAMPSGSRISKPLLEQAGALRAEIGVAATARRRGEALSATGIRSEALRREIAGSGLGALSPGGIEALDRLLETARTRDRRRRALAPVSGLLLVTCGVIAAVAAISGRTRLALLVTATLAAVLLAVSLAARLGTGSSARARRELARRLPGLDLDCDTLDDLAAALPDVRRLHHELHRQQALADAHRAELESARAELESVVARCCRLAGIAGVSRDGPPPSGSTLPILVQAAVSALDAIADAAAVKQRRTELEAEDDRLAVRERQLTELGQEAERRRTEAAEVERRIIQITTNAGLDPVLPAPAAVASFRDGCHHRRAHDQAAAALIEVGRRRRLAGGDVQILRQRRQEFAAELRRRGGDPALASSAPTLDGKQLAALERTARTAQARATETAADARALGARLEGLTASLPSLADLEDERASVAGARARALRQGEGLQLAIRLIEAASQGVHRDLAPRLAASVAGRLALLTESRYRDVNVDTEHFAVSLLCADRPEMVPLEQTSHGTRDQVSLLLRIALCEVLSDAGEPIPLLLDEPFQSSDLARRRSLLEFLAKLSATNQVVFTTSEPAVAAAMASISPADKGAVTVIDLDSDPEQPALDLAAEVPASMRLTTPGLRRRR